MKNKQQYDKMTQVQKIIQGSINVERRGIGNENVLKQRNIWRHEEIIKLIKLKTS
jgi:uncharacterized protein YjaZ